MAGFNEEDYLDSLLKSVGTESSNDKLKKDDDEIEEILDFNDIVETPDNQNYEKDNFESEIVLDEKSDDILNENPESDSKKEDISSDLIDSSTSDMAGIENILDSLSKEISEAQADTVSSPDFDEPELSDSDKNRLSHMELDSLLDDISDDSFELDDLFNDELFKSKVEAQKENVSEDSVDNKEDNALENTEDNVPADNYKSDSSSDLNDEEQASQAISQLTSQTINDVKNELDEEQQDGGKKKKKKGGFLNLIKNIFFEEIDDEIKNSVVGEEPKDKKTKKSAKKAGKKSEKKTDKNAENSEASEMDENEKLINEVFGDEDNLDDNEAPKENFFAKIKYRINQFIKRNAEEEAAEEEAEAIDDEERRVKKEAKMAAKAEKKAAEEEKKKEAPNPKKEKKAKPKKEKKPKPEPKPGDILKIKPKSMILFVAFVAGVCLLIVVLNTTSSYSQSVNLAKGYFENGNYEKAYDELAGLNLTNESDETMFKQITLIMYVRGEYNSYKNLSKLDMKKEALNCLIKGVKKYHTYYDEAVELGIEDSFNSVKDELITELFDIYGISEVSAKNLADMYDSNFVEYNKLIEKYGKVKK